MAGGRLRLGSERGQALPMVLGAMLVFAIATVTVMVYASSSQRAADAQKKGASAQEAAEEALATAISVLANAPDPTVVNALPGCTPPTALPTPPPGTAADYCGMLVGSDWTITAHGSVAKGTSADTAQVRVKTITQVASIVPFYWGGLGALWDRIYQYDNTHCAVFNKDIITVPVVARGCVTMTGDDAHPTRLLGSLVSIGGNLTLKDQDSIGVPGTNIPRAEIAGTCTIEHGTGAHTPCGPADGVYADSVSTTPTSLARPSVDFNYWYANAKPGPMTNCTTGSLPGTAKFDKNTTYNTDNAAVQLTPSGVNYSCQVWSIPPASGKLLGELSWDSVNQILTVRGTVFFDGDVKATAPGHSKACLKAVHGPFCDTTFSYVGRGTIYAAGKVDVEAGLCAGGDGGNDCETDISNWDPRQNLLIFITGGLNKIGDDSFVMNKDQAIFQGAVWSAGKCKVNYKASVSAPLICGTLSIKETDTDDPSVNPWPQSLIGSSTGQVYPSPSGDFQLALGPELGG